MIDPHSVIEMALRVLNAANPDQSAEVEALAKKENLSDEEIKHFNELTDISYQDPHLHIDTWPERTEDEGSFLEISIYVPGADESVEWEGSTVFVGYVWFDKDKIDIETFEDGPWIEHLQQIARRL